MARFPGACSALSYMCELDFGHAGMHRDGNIEWGKVFNVT